ncbi:MFS transporter [Hoyosella rhizosphaerae]|uniref:MFS transporter n=1 Tax=Hoyosella rhizosphaerae TaxID=1755582 RepID=A0A916UAA3_9ACTN|nr:MFS transporter [Hoyosella rhizosphaerae]MBN4926144.1 MFS transporter [Hoyosella rhizosphaerae]GGC65195.1 MFS transporter [Hoyosella rhizosphaerae]
MTASSADGALDAHGRSTDELVGSASKTRQVISWGLWDAGNSSFHALVVTFVFAVYLVNAVGDDITGPFSASTWLAWSLALGGIVIAILAPVTGQRSDAAGKRKKALAVLTIGTIICMFLMFNVKSTDSPLVLNLGFVSFESQFGYFWLGLGLLALAAAFSELANVPYNAMLRQVSRPDNVGRVSGIAWSFGYFGGIFLLLFSFFGFMAGDGDQRGFLGLSTDEGFNVRMVVVMAAVWFAILAIPLFLAVPELPRDPRVDTKMTFRKSYAKVFRDVRVLYREDRRTLWYLLAQGVFRDGLSGVFAFGAILAVTVYGITESDVLLFGAAANIVAGIGAVLAGFFDDRFGPKAVIVTGLSSMIVTGAILLVVDGPAMFWVFGLILCFWVGPIQSSARTFLVRLTPPGREGEMFGLYLMVGRAVSFLTPALFGLFVWLFAGDRFGILGIILVLSAGLALLLTVRKPDQLGVGLAR